MRIHHCKFVAVLFFSLVFLVNTAILEKVAAETNSTKEVSEFHLAVSEGETDTVNRMLAKNKALVHQRDENDFTPLFEAAIAGRTEIAEKLLRLGARVDDRVLGETPLFRACLDGSTETAAVLIKHGAAIDAFCNDETPLQVAIDRLHPSIVRLLLDHGANPNGRPIRGEESYEFLEKHSLPLIDALAQVRWTMQRLHVYEVTGDKERIPKYETYRDHAVKIAKMLIVHEKTKLDAIHPRGGGTALHIAAACGHLELGKLLIEKGATVDMRAKRSIPSPVVQSPYNQTPLHFAMAADHTDFIKLLLDKGADPKAKDSRGTQAIEYTKENFRR